MNVIHNGPPDPEIDNLLDYRRCLLPGSVVYKPSRPRKQTTKETLAMKRHVLLITGFTLLTACGGSNTSNAPPSSSPSQTNTSATNTNKNAMAPDTASAIKPSCLAPDFPEPTALAIDAQCGNEGNGGKEAAQNSVKNNFCPPSETPADITIAAFQQLQKDVENNSSINFGSSGPTTDRSPLKTLGEGKLVTLKAFILKARQEGGESVNCKGHLLNETDKTDFYHDIHISFVDDANKPQTGDAKAISDKKECTGIVAEMSPHHRPDNWTADNVNKVVAAKALVRITGQQFFDSSHVPCSNGAPLGSNPKRISLWEIHPIYKFEVCTGDCAGAGQWVSLDEWLKTH